MMNNNLLGIVLTPIMLTSLSDGKMDIQSAMYQSITPSRNIDYVCDFNGGSVYSLGFSRESESNDIGVVRKFAQNLLKSIKSNDAEIQEVINGHFWEMI